MSMEKDTREQVMGIGIIGAGLVAWFVVWLNKEDPKPAPPAPAPAAAVVVADRAETRRDEMRGMFDTTIDAARDRAIAKAGTSWPEIQKWVGQFRRVMDALDPANKPQSESPPTTTIPPSPAAKREIKLPTKQPVTIPNAYVPSGRFRVWRSY